MMRLIKMRNSGFTLVELMIVVAIVAIVAAFAIPGYAEYVRRGNRADAKSVMLQAGNWMQQQYTLNNVYPAAAALPFTKSPISGTAKYTVSVSARNNTTYTIQAVPVSADAYCGTLSITNDGVRGMTGSKDVDYCWNK